MKKHLAFTLAEVLIALALLGVIAAFSIPKILTNNQNQQSRLQALEVASMWTQAFEQYKVTHAVTITTINDDLIPFLNVLARDTTTIIDDHPCPGAVYAPGNTIDCGQAGRLCYKLHNGGILRTDSNQGLNFSPTDPVDPLQTLYVTIDPDGKASNIPATLFIVYPNGKLLSLGTATPGTRIANNVHALPAANPACDPDYFSWR